MLDVRRLLILREVARHGSFSAAARALNYSQSAVSQQIATLEREADVRLIERIGRSVRLTEAAWALVRRTEVIVAELAAADAELRALASGHGGRIRLSTFASAATSLVPATLTRFRATYPEVEVELSLVESPTDAMGRVRTGEVDLALLVQPIDPPATVPTGIRLHPLFDDPMLAVLPAAHKLAGHQLAGHQLAGQPDVALTDLAGEPWVLGGGADCPDRDIILRACRMAGFEPVVAIRFPTDDYNAVQGMVAAGAGVTVLPRLALAVPRADVVTRPMSCGLARRVVAATGETVPAAVQAVLDLLLSANAHAGPAA
jgi:DNA-binding transcriptional LysR family regulator